MAEQRLAAQSLYADAAYYHMMFDERVHDLPFYEGVGRASGNVVELGVGTGRVALPLARAGVEVAGVDSAGAMLAELERRAAGEDPRTRERLTWHQADVKEVRLERRFGAVLYPFNGLAHHHRDPDLAAVFDTVRAHLAPGGVFAFDVVLPNPAVLGGTRATVPWFRHPATGEVCRCDEVTTYDPQHRLMTCTVTIRFMEGERTPQVLSWQLRQWYPEEIAPLLERHGFRLTRCPIELGDTRGYVARCEAGFDQSAAR